MAQKGSNPPPTGARPAPPPPPPLTWAERRRREEARLEAEFAPVLAARREAAERASEGRPAACACAGAVARLVWRSEQLADDVRDLWLAAGVALVLGAVALVVGVCALAAAW